MGMKLSLLHKQGILKFNKSLSQFLNEMCLTAVPCSIYSSCDKTLLPVGVMVNADDTFTDLVKMYIRERK